MSLKHYRNQSKQFLKALQSGSAEAAERVFRNLPRLSGCSVADVLAAAAASFQEMQHVVATEHGYGNWADLPDVNGTGFEDLVQLTDAEIEFLLREIEQLDLITAFKGLDTGAVSKRRQACLGLLQHVTERMRDLHARRSAVPRSVTAGDRTGRRLHSGAGRAPGKGGPDRLAAGQASDMHQHDDKEQVYYVTEREGVVVTGTRLTGCAKGMRCTCPAPCPIWFSTTPATTGCHTWS